MGGYQPERKRHERLSGRWIILKRSLNRFDGVNWIQLAKNRVPWRAFVNTAMNLWGSINRGEFLEHPSDYKLLNKGSIPITHNVIFAFPYKSKGRIKQFRSWALADTAQPPTVLWPKWELYCVFHMGTWASRLVSTLRPSYDGDQCNYSVP
jgi:hypothetical protein